MVDEIQPNFANLEEELKVIRHSLETESLPALVRLKMAGRLAEIRQQLNSLRPNCKHENHGSPSYDGVERDQPIILTESIFDAIRENDLAKVKACAGQIESGGLSWSPLHEAAKRGRTEILEFILAQRFVDVNDGFEIGEPDDWRRGTALTEALVNGHLEIARVLIEHGADVNAAYYDYENTHILGFEVEESGNCLTLALAGADALIELMMARGLDVDRPDGQDMTPFARALGKGDVSRLDRLGTLGANTRQFVKDAWSYPVTPLMAALWLYREAKAEAERTKYFAVVEWLLARGADLSHVHEGAELPTALAVVLDANDPELNRLFGWVTNDSP